MIIAREIADKSLLIYKLVVYEILTLISRRMDQDVAKSIYNDISFMNLYTTRELEAEYFREFLSYDKKNISLVDCVNLTLAKKFKAKIATFDRFYPKEFLVQNTGFAIFQVNCQR